MYFTSASSDISLREGDIYRDEQKLFSFTGQLFASTDILLTFIHQKGDNLQFSVSYK